MTEPTTYTVIGAGAVGLLYGSRLADAGSTVRWVVRSGAEEIRRDGITVESEGRTLHLPAAEVEVFTDARKAPASDVVVLAVKTTENHSVVEAVRAAVRPGTAVALFQNGLGFEERVRETVPEAGAVLGAMCFVCSHRTGPGRATHMDYGAVTLAALDGSEDDASLARLAADLQSAGIETIVHPDLQEARWRKLVWNVPFNGLATILDARTDELLAVPDTRRLAAEIMDEVIAAAVACGSTIEAGFRDEMLDRTDAMAPYEPSMLLDRRAGRALEVDAIYGEACSRATAAGSPMPKSEALAALLRFVDPARSPR